MRPEGPVAAGTYSFFNLGCPKNLVDAERVAARLEEMGWREAAGPGTAALLVVTTCAFISSAIEESIEEILRVGSAKRPGQTLAVLGCLVSREAEALRKLIPEVDIFCDVGEMLSLPDRIAPPPRSGARANAGRKLFTPPHLAYLKISDGCANRCSYCMIPAIRGGLASRSKSEILEEVSGLAAAGVKELTVVAQDTTAWGLDRGGSESLYDLLEAIADRGLFEWIRLMYLHPGHINVERLVPLIRGGAICPYLDIPIQHASDAILERMGRPYTRRDLESLFARLRSSIDDLVLRTTVMTGFPGETERHAGELADFLEEISFDHVGVFVYSPEAGTRAMELRGRVPARVALERRDNLLGMQMDISHERLNGRLGSEVDVLVDVALPADERPRRGVAWAGRFYGQAFDVDGVTYLTGNVEAPGAFVRARIVEAQAYDLVAEVVP